MIIGLIGFKQVGKSTAAKHLESRGFKRINMKDALVAELKQNFPDLIQAIIDIMEKEYWEGKPWTFERLVAEKPPLFRALMQNYGTEVRRRDNDNYWVGQWKTATYADNNIVCDDVRFTNEAEAVKERGGILVRLERPDVATGGTHQSETEQLSIVADYTITVEQGDFQKLYEELDRIILPPENWSPND